MSLDRRRFLAITGIATAVGLVGTIVRFANQPRRSYVKEVVRERLTYLNFNEEVLNRFADDFVALTPAMDSFRGQVVSFGGMTLSRALGRIGGANTAFKVNAFEQKIASDFLKSTDFFDGGADTGRELEYLTFPDPYLAPCRNVLANLNL